MTAVWHNQGYYPRGLASPVGCVGHITWRNGTKYTRQGYHCGTGIYPQPVFRRESDAKKWVEANWKIDALYFYTDGRRLCVVNSGGSMLVTNTRYEYGDSGRLNGKPWPSEWNDPDFDHSLTFSQLVHEMGGVEN